MRERRLEAAERLYRLAVQYGAPAEMKVGDALLAQGRIEEAWPFYEHRRVRERLIRSRLSMPEWLGEDLTGKNLFVWYEQGFGDQIWAARFLPLLNAAKVTYFGTAPLERLFRVLGVDYRVVDGEVDVSGFDCWVTAMSLPYRLGLTPAAMPRPPYLTASARPSSGRVGVMFEGNPENPNQPFRSIPGDLRAALLGVPGAIDLSPAATGARDFMDTAEIIAGLDLVISVDTAVAHLAAALGAPCWVLLSRERLDWFWPEEGPSTWYPEARTFHQPTPGDWHSVIDAVLQELAAAR